MNGPWRAPSRLWLVIPVALTLALAAFLALRSPAPLSPEAAMAGALAGAQAEELGRCRAAGENALRDPACQAEWRAARRRFLGQRP
jgi:conjugative transfer region protein TrbK